MNILRALPDLVLLYLLYHCYLRNRWRNYMFKEHTMMYVSFCLIIFVTLCPIIMNIPNLFRGTYANYNFEAFVDLLHGYGNPVTEALANIALFVPFSFAYRYCYRRPLFETIACGFALSLLIELFQPLISTYRVCDITDIITNTCGAVIGAYLYDWISFLRSSRN